MLPKKESLHASSRGNTGTATACRACRVAAGSARARGGVVALAGFEDLLEIGAGTKGYLWEACSGCLGA